MKRTISLTAALSAAVLFLLPSCLGKGKNTPLNPQIPPISTLTGKVEKRTTTRLDANLKEESRIEETFRKSGGLLSKLTYTKASDGTLKVTDRLTNTYDEQGNRLIQEHEVTKEGGQTERTRLKYTYRAFSPSVSYVSRIDEYDTQDRLVKSTAYELEGSRLQREIETTYSYEGGAQKPKVVLRTSYDFINAVIVGRTFQLVPNPKNPQQEIALWHKQATFRTDYYGRKVYEEVLSYDTTQPAGQQDLKKPLGATVSTWRYGAMGDVAVELRETHGRRSQEELDKDPQHKLTYLKLIDRYFYEGKYSRPNNEGFPTQLDVTIEQGVAKVKTTYSCTISYTYFK